MVEEWEVKNVVRTPPTDVCPLLGLKGVALHYPGVLEHYGEKAVRRDVRTRAEAVAEACIAERQRTRDQIVELVFMDGKGVILWHIVHRLIRAGILDAVHITVVDLDNDMIAYHRFAYPRSVVHVHTDVFRWLLVPPRPDRRVCYFNFSQLSPR